MADYPTLASGVIANIGWSRTAEFLTAKTVMPTGWQFAYAWRTSNLWRWKLPYVQLSDADAATLRAHFVAMYGRYGEFNFTDPETATVYPKVRFASDELSIIRNGPNNNSVTVELVQYA